MESKKARILRIIVKLLCARQVVIHYGMNTLDNSMTMRSHRLRITFTFYSIEKSTDARYSCCCRQKIEKLINGRKKILIQTSFDSSINFSELVDAFSAPIFSHATRL